MSLVLDDLPRDPEWLLQQLQQVAEVAATERSRNIALEIERDTAMAERDAVRAERDAAQAEIEKLRRRIHGRSATCQAKRICTSLPSSASNAWSGVRKPRHLRGVRLWLSTISCSSASLSASRSRSRGRSRRSLPFAFSTAPFVCWRDPIWYRDRVGRRETARPQAHQGRGRTRGLAGRVPATRTVTRAEKPASSETGSWTRLPPSSASTSPSGGSTSTCAPPARASPPPTTTRAWRGSSSARPPPRPRPACSEPPAGRGGGPPPAPPPAGPPGAAA